MSWINHLPPACWSTFWKSIFKQQLGCRFYIMDSISAFFWYFDICNYICLDTSYHFWLYLYFLIILYSFSNTPVLTSSIDVVLVLSISICLKFFKTIKKNIFLKKNSVASKLHFPRTTVALHVDKPKYKFDIWCESYGLFTSRFPDVLYLPPSPRRNIEFITNIMGLQTYCRDLGNLSFNLYATIVHDDIHRNPLCCWWLTYICTILLQCTWWYS